MQNFKLSSDTIQELLAFRSDRKWERFHTEAALARSIVIESAELLEHFQWDGFKPVDPDGIKQEVADVIIYLFYFCHARGIDINNAVMEKIKLNAAKYPKERP